MAMAGPSPRKIRRVIFCLIHRTHETEVKDEREERETKKPTNPKAKVTEIERNSKEATLDEGVARVQNGLEDQVETGGERRYKAEDEGHEEDHDKEHNPIELRATIRPSKFQLEVSELGDALEDELRPTETASIPPYALVPR